MIEYYKKIVKRGELKRLKDYSKDCWVNVIDPSKKEINFLVDKFKLEKDLVLDALDIYETPRIEEEEGKAYFFLRVPISKIENEYTNSFLIIISKTVFIIISKTDLELFDAVINTKNFLTNQRTRCLLQILLFLSVDYNTKIRTILREVKKDRGNIRNLKEKDILDLVLQEDILNDYLSSFNPLINMHIIMVKLKSIRFKEEEKEFIEDLMIDLNQTLNSCKSALKSISNMRDYYQTTLSNNLNKILTVLTIFTVFMTIPAVLSGVYGMNVVLPFQQTPNIFWMLAGVIILIWLIVIVIFKKTRIL